MTLVILGGNNLIVSYLLPRLGRKGMPAVVVARRHVDVPEGFTFRELDVLDAPDWTAPEGAVVISALPLPVLTRTLPRLSGVHSIVAIGATSRCTQRGSAAPKVRASAGALEEAEASLAEWCARNDVRYTILRPTLVYDGSGDRNIARMAGFIRRFRVLLLAKPATGLRQPIHADDVAKAIVGAIGNTAAEDKTFDIAGGEVLTYRAMAERVFAVQGIRPRLLMLPARWLRSGFGLAQMCGIGREQGFGSAVFGRMNEDLVFDIAEGLTVLNYDPRPFQPRAFAPSEKGRKM